MTKIEEISIDNTHQAAWWTLTWVLWVLEKFKILLLPKIEDPECRRNFLNAFELWSKKPLILMHEMHEKYGRIMDDVINSDPLFQSLSQWAKRMYLLIVDRKWKLLKKSEFLEVSTNLSADSKQLDDFLKQTTNNSFISIRGRGYRYAEKNDNERFKINNPEVIRIENTIHAPQSFLPDPYTPVKRKRKKTVNPNHPNFTCDIEDFFTDWTVAWSVFQVFLKNPNIDLSLREVWELLPNVNVNNWIQQIRHRLNLYRRAETLENISRWVYRYIPSIKESKDESE